MSVKYALLGILAERERLGDLPRDMQRLTQRKVEISKRADREAELATELLMDAALLHADADIRWLALVEQKLRVPHGKGKR